MTKSLVVLVVLATIAYITGSPYHRQKRAACVTNSDCQNSGTCMSDQCYCQAGFFGDNCELKCGKADVFYIIDGSGSIKEPNWDPVLKFYTNLTKSFNVSPHNINIGTVTYSKTAVIEFGLTKYTNSQDVINAVNSLTYPESSTNTSGALWLTFEKGFKNNRTDAKDICILFTDGKSNVDANLTIPYGNELKDRGCATFVVAIGPVQDLNENEIDAMSSTPLDKFKLWEQDRTDFSKLNRFIPPIVNQACSETLKADPCISKPCQRGGQCTVLNANIPTFKCDCPDPYNTKYCDGLPCEKLEICFLVDGSTSVRPERWGGVLDFLEKTVDEIPIRMDGARFGLLTFSHTFNLVMNVSAYTDKTDVKQEIGNIPFPSGGTETQKGIKLALDDCFEGTRPDAKKKLFVVTDGSYQAHAEKNMTIQLERCKREEVEVFSFGFGLFHNLTQLKTMATDPINNVLTEFDVSNLAGRAVDLVKSMCGPRPCLSNPCQNGGACTYDPTDPGGYNGFTCKCPNGNITGVLCERVNYCQNYNPCNNGGKCSNTPTGPACTCVKPWSGQFCDTLDCGETDVCFLLDSSASARESWNGVLKAVEKITDLLDIDDNKVRVGIVEFSTQNKLINPLLGNRAGLKNSIKNMNGTFGGTLTLNGLQRIYAQCFARARPSAKKRLITVVDGKDPRSQSVSEEVKKLVKDKGVDTFAVAYGHNTYGPKIDLAFLKQADDLANHIPASKFIYNTEIDFIQHAKDIAAAICRDVDYCSSSPCQNNGVCVPNANGYTCDCPPNLSQPHCIDACQSSPCQNSGVCTSSSSGYKCACDSGLIQPNCIDACDSSPCPSGATCVSSSSGFTCQCPGQLLPPNCVCPEIDVCIVLDSSFSVNETSEWPLVKTWAVKLFNRLASDEIKVGAGVFSSKAHLNFAVGDYSNKGDGDRKMGGLPYISGGTEIVDAMDMIEKSCFAKSTSSSKKIGVLVVDGPYRDDNELQLKSEEVETADIEIVAIGYKWAREDQLKNIARDKTGRHFKVPAAQDFTDDFAAKIEKAICDKGI